MVIGDNPDGNLVKGKVMREAYWFLFYFLASY